MSRPRVQSLIKLTYWTFSVGSIYGSFSMFSVCDPVGIQTQDLQNRNLTLYSAKLRDHCAFVAAKVRIKSEWCKF